jgi:hypothetical protein
MDRCNIAAMVNLDGRWGDELKASLTRYDRAYPGRFVTFCHVDWACLRKQGDQAWRRLADNLAESVMAGARGLKVWKDLGLHVRDELDRLVLPDDPRLFPLWQRAEDLGVPIAIHTADPVAFFDPLDARNERLEELLAHPDWSYANPRFPRFERLIAALETVVATHPAVTFIGLHVGCYAEDLSWVDRMLDTYPNFYVDIGGRIAELGRQPRAARDLILRHPGRILFGTDQISPTRDVYENHFSFLETTDEYFPYSREHPPPQGRWMIYGLNLPKDILEQVYATSARQLIPGL